jgi:hypothetical protein
MDPTKAAQLHEAERLLSGLDSKARSAKVKAATNLSTIAVYPDLITESGQFLQTFMTPVLLHFGDDTEKVRELCVALCHRYVQALHTTNFIDTLTYVIPPIYARLKDGGEPTEHIRLALMSLLLELIGYCGPDSFPASWDQFVPPMEPLLKFGFKAADAEMIKKTCQVVDAVLSKISEGVFHPYGGVLVKAILPNCSHRHNEVRRVSLMTLGRVLVASQYYDEIDDIQQVVVKLAFDNTAAVRRAVIDFLRLMLVEHAMRHVMYHPLLLTLCYFMAPLVPLRPIYSGVQPKKLKESAELAEMAFSVATDIGRQHEEDKHDDFRKELQYFEEERFDDQRSIPRGLTHIIQDVFSKWMDRRLPMLSDWTENARRFSYLAMRSILHVALAYSTRYVPQIIRGLTVSLRDFPKEADDSLQVAAVLASNVPASEIITMLLPQLTNDGPPNTVLLLATTTLNDNPNDGELGTILDGLGEAGTYETRVARDSLVQLLLSMIKRSADFADINAVNLISMILKISEHSDVLDAFQDAFGRPLGLVFADHMELVLRGAQFSVGCLKSIVKVTPPDALLNCQRDVCNFIAKQFSSAVAELSPIIMDLATNGSFQNLPADFIDFLVQNRNCPAAVFAKLIETNSLDSSLYGDKTHSLLAGILETMSRPTPEERLVAMGAIKTYEAKSNLPVTEFDNLYPALLERLKDHMVEIRVIASEVLASYLPKAESAAAAVIERLKEIVVSIDDENLTIRTAVANLCRILSKVDAYRPAIIELLQTQKNYHSEATAICETLLTEFLQ